MCAIFLANCCKWMSTLITRLNWNMPTRIKFVTLAEKIATGVLCDQLYSRWNFLFLALGYENFGRWGDKAEKREILKRDNNTIITDVFFFCKFCTRFLIAIPFNAKVKSAVVDSITLTFKFFFNSDNKRG